MVNNYANQNNINDLLHVLDMLLADTNEFFVVLKFTALLKMGVVHRKENHNVACQNS